MNTEITAVVSGSFKYKPEIDRTIEILEETGIKVLEPAKGWLIVPDSKLIENLSLGQIRPLPSEEGLSTKQIEDRFLRALGNASLMYLMNCEGYVGNSTGLEIGFALGRNKPIYSLEALDFEAMGIYDLDTRDLLSSYIKVLPPEEIASQFAEIALKE